MRKILLLLFIAIPSFLNAQETAIEIKNPLFIKAKKMIRHKAYGSAHQVFDNVLKGSSDSRSFIYESALYNKLYCEFKLDMEGAKDKMQRFIGNYPQSRFIIPARLLLAYYQFDNEKYRSALSYMNKVIDSDLEKTVRLEFLFKKAYCNLMCGKEKEAANDFFYIESLDGSYKDLSRFYYANITFKQKKYQTSLKSFQALQSSPDYKHVVPYYIVQIYYTQGKFKKVTSLGEKYYGTVDGERKMMLARIIAHSFFTQGNYKKAIKYYDYYLSSVGEGDKVDNYSYAFSLYKENKIDKAIEYFKKIGGNNDEINQFATYTLAACYLKKENKENARNALMLASHMNFDEEIKENSLFNVAKLNYELEYSPFNEALNSFDDYIAKYPDSRRNQEAYDCLADVYDTVKDYKAAIESIKKIKIKTTAIRAALQKVAYNRGIELFNQEDYYRALESFNLSLTEKRLNNKIAASCVFWKAESYFKLHKYLKAIEHYNKFLVTPGSSLLKNYPMGYYGLAYSYLQLDKVEEAMEMYKAYELAEGNKHSIYLSDARCRLLDYYLYVRKYRDCINFANKIIGMNSFSIDYALLKKAVAYGLLGDKQKQISALNEIINKHKKSKYFYEAYYEAGDVALSMGNNSLSKRYFKDIISQERSFKYDAMAELQLALIEFNENDLSSAEKYYKRVLADYIGTEYAIAAKKGLKNVMLEQNRVDDYYKFLNESGMQTNKDLMSRDSLSFIAAERLYMDDKLPEAIDALSSYVEKSDSKEFKLVVNYYLADAYYRTNQEEKSLEFYNALLSDKDNTYTLDASYHAAEINFKLKNYLIAIEEYKTVERLTEDEKDNLYAKWKIFQAYSELNDDDKVVLYGEKLLESKGTNDDVIFDIQAKLADSYNNLGNNDKALKYYKIIAKNLKSEIGANAKYFICNYLFEKKMYDDSKKEIDSFMDSGSTQYFYIARSVILLAKIYMIKKDAFQAKYTLMSLLENYPNKNDGVIAEASKILKEIKDKEEKSQKSIKKSIEKKKINIEKKDFDNYRQKVEKEKKNVSKDSISNDK